MVVRKLGVMFGNTLTASVNTADSFRVSCSQGNLFVSDFHSFMFRASFSRQVKQKWKMHTSSNLWYRLKLKFGNVLISLLSQFII